MSNTLTLADGTEIDTATGRPVRQEQPQQYVEVPTRQQAQELVVSVRRKMSDLPDIPENMHPIAVVLSYSLFGMSDEQIAIATNTSPEYILNMKATEAYTKMHDDLVEGIIASQRDAVEQILANAAGNAARKHVELIQSDDEKVALKASAGILDRTNIGRNSREGKTGLSSLNIVIKKSNAKDDEQINIRMD